MGSERTDEELVREAQAAREGDMRAFEELVRRHERKVLANCRYLTRRPGDSEDLAQEVFVKAFFGLKRFEGRSSFKTWIQRIKANHCLNFIKKHQGKTFVDIEDVDAAGADEVVARSDGTARTEAVHEREIIAQVLDAMSDTLRVPLIMRDLDQLSYQEIAETLGVGLSAVKMRIKRAREEFRSRYAALGRSPDRTAEDA